MGTLLQFSLNVYISPNLQFFGYVYLISRFAVLWISIYIIFQFIVLCLYLHFTCIHRIVCYNFLFMFVLHLCVWSCSPLVRMESLSTYAYRITLYLHVQGYRLQFFVYVCSNPTNLSFNRMISIFDIQQEHFVKHFKN